MFRNSNRGFTLIEILMVVVILAIASAIIIPEIGTRDDLKVAAGARNVMSDLMWAQNRAVSTQQKQYVVFSGQSYTLRYKNSSGSIQDSTQPVTLGTYKTTFGKAGTPLADVSISGTPSFGGVNSVCFDEMGTPWGYNGTVESSLTQQGSIAIGSGAQKLTVYVEPYTGETSVK